MSDESTMDNDDEWRDTLRIRGDAFGVVMGVREGDTIAGLLQPDGHVCTLRNLNDKHVATLIDGQPGQLFRVAGHGEWSVDKHQFNWLDVWHIEPSRSDATQLFQRMREYLSDEGEREVRKETREIVQRMVLRPDVELDLEAQQTLAQFLDRIRDIIDSSDEEQVGVDDGD
jgi:hypothetical protein